MPTILAWGGIGDTLRNIALVPHEAIYRATGLRFRVVYKNWRDAGCLPHAHPPEPDFFESLIARVPSLEWRGESGEHRGVPQVANRLLRELLRVSRGGSPRYYPTIFQLSNEEQAALLPRQQGLTIGVQTHLSGMRTKQWGLENWLRFLKELLQLYPESHVRLYETAPAVDALCFDARITSTRHYNLPQSIASIRNLDFLISIDSWTKYVAAWCNVPQLIIVPDQRIEYPALTARRLARHEFAGLARKPIIMIYGLELVGSSARLTLPRISEVTPRILLAQLQQHLRLTAEQSHR